MIHQQTVAKVPNSNPWQSSVPSLLLKINVFYTEKIKRQRKTIAKGLKIAISLCHTGPNSPLSTLFPKLSHFLNTGLTPRLYLLLQEVSICQLAWKTL